MSDQIASSAANQLEADQANASYWDSLCGWALAQTVEMTGEFQEDLRRFDATYLDYYPYLLDYIDPPALADRDVLEIGLGYGTVGQLLALARTRYVGLDVAAEPVELMRRRLASLDGVDGRAERGSALALPFPDETFDYVYSIGCLHHTGNLARAVSEVRRVLRPGGIATIMVYYRYSLRRLAFDAKAILRREQPSVSAALASAAYDLDEAGAAPPHTEYASRQDVQRLFAGFSSTSTDIRNFQEWAVLGLPVKRTWFLDNVARRLGLDIYVVATR